MNEPKPRKSRFFGGLKAPVPEVILELPPVPQPASQAPLAYTGLTGKTETLHTPQEPFLWGGLGGKPVLLNPYPDDHPFFGAAARERKIREDAAPAPETTLRSSATPRPAVKGPKLPGNKM